MDWLRTAWRLPRVFARWASWSCTCRSTGDALRAIGHRSSNKKCRNRGAGARWRSSATQNLRSCSAEPTSMKRWASCPVRRQGRHRQAHREQREPLECQVTMERALQIKKNQTLLLSHNSRIHAFRRMERSRLRLHVLAQALGAKAKQKITPPAGRASHAPRSTRNLSPSTHHDKPGLPSIHASSGDRSKVSAKPLHTHLHAQNLGTEM